jgi:hypothetical protein
LQATSLRRIVRNLLPKARENSRRWGLDEAWLASELLKDYEGNSFAKTIANLNPFERTKVYLYPQSYQKNGQTIE